MIQEKYAQKEPLLMKEYGRNIQNIVRHISKIEDKEIQRKNIEATIKVMKSLYSFDIKKEENYLQKIWDHLVIISDFKLADVSPYPEPSKDNIYQKPSKTFTYPNYKTKTLHFGRYLADLSKKCMEEPNADIQKEYFKHILYYIRLVRINERREQVSKESIKRDFSKLTQSKFEGIEFIDKYIAYLHSNFSIGYNNKLQGTNTNYNKRRQHHGGSSKRYSRDR